MFKAQEVATNLCRNAAIFALVWLNSYLAMGQLTSVGSQLWHQDSPGVPGGAEAGDRHGSSLARGDFNGDGRQDLAIGADEEDIGTVQGAGAVSILYGTATGLSAVNSQIWHQDSPDIPDTAEEQDAFGGTLAAGDFDGDGYDDLAIGVYDEGIGGVAQAGQVHILYGSVSGLTTTGNQVFNQNSGGMADSAEQSDLFGAALCAGDFNDDGFADLAVGVYETFESMPQVDSFQGAVSVIYGSVSGLSTTLNQFWTQDSPGVPDASADGDRFGVTLACADYDGDGYGDLAIGSFDEVDGEAEAGSVTVLYGAPGTLTATGSQLWTQNSPGIGGVAEAGDRFAGVAGGDLNGDGYDDLAVGVVFEAIGSAATAGAVNIIFGSAAGLTGTGSQLWYEDLAEIPGVSEAGDHFGAGLAIGYFDPDPYADLAIGVPNQDLISQTIPNAGLVHVLHGSAVGLTSMGHQDWVQIDFGLVPEENEFFGQTLVTGDFNGNGVDELAIGVFNQDINLIENAGAVRVIPTIVVFTDGFESGDTSAWTDSVP